MLGFVTLSSQKFVPAKSIGEPPILPVNFRPKNSSRSNHIANIAAEIVDQVAVRHAEAEHNLRGIFNGAPENKDLYGLTDKGKFETIQLLPALTKWIEKAQKQLFIVHSDFRRTCEMADILLKGLGNLVIGTESRPELRERNPGLLEGIAYREFLSKFHLSAHEDESEKPKATRSKLKKSMLELVLRSNVLTPPSKHILGLEPVRAVEDRTTKLIKEFHERQNVGEFLVLYIGHEFCLGPALNAFLGRKAGMFWTNRHIPRAKPFMLSITTAQQHFLKEISLPSLPLQEAA